VERVRRHHARCRRDGPLLRANAGVAPSAGGAGPVIVLLICRSRFSGDPTMGARCPFVCRTPYPGPPTSDDGRDEAGRPARAPHALAGAALTPRRHTRAERPWAAIDRCACARSADSPLGGGARRRGPRYSRLARCRNRRAGRRRHARVTDHVYGPCPVVRHTRCVIAAFRAAAPRPRRYGVGRACGVACGSAAPGSREPDSREDATSRR